MQLQLGVNFAPKREEKQKQSPSDAIFSQPNSKTHKKNAKVFNAVCAIFIRLIEMKTKTRTFYWTISLFVVLLCDSSFIVQYMFFVRYLTATIE